MQELETEYGKIKYRYPNIPEAMNLLGKIGISKVPEEDASNEYIMLGLMIENMKNLVQEVDVEIGKEKITDYNTLLKYNEMAGYLSQVATDIFDKMNFTGKKKS